MIITLPITVHERALLGYWLTPVLTDALAKHRNEEGRVFYGKLGLRAVDSGAEEIFHQDLDYLGVGCARTADACHRDALLELVGEVAQRNALKKRTAECYQCRCGRLELPVAAAPFLKGKTFIRRGEEYVCAVCHEVATRGWIESVNLQIDPDTWDEESVTVYPRSYKKEVRELRAQIDAQGISFARSRHTGIVWNGQNLDVELAWLLLATLLALEGNEEVRIVVTNHVLRQAVAAFLIAQSCHRRFKGEIIVAPCVIHPGQPEKWRLPRLRSLGFTGNLLRTMLLGSLGWQAKDVRLFDDPASVELRRFCLFERLVANAPSMTAVTSVSENMKNLSQQNIAAGLKHVFNPERFGYQTLRGLF